MLWNDMYASNNIYANNNSNGSLPSLQNYQPPLNKQQVYNHQTQLSNGGSIGSSAEEEEVNPPKPPRKTNLKRKYSEGDESSEEKRKNFLERNRQAALKCRQRKKQWLNNLQERIEFLANDNEQLQLQANILRDEMRNLQNLLLMHKDCPINNGSAPPLSQHSSPNNNLYNHAHM